MPDEPMFLLTKEEWEAIIAALPEGDTCGQCREAIAQAALRKVATWLKQHSYHYSPEFPGEASLRHVTYWNSEIWDALMREAGLPEEAPDAH